jgi:hypothetical protein
MASKIVPAFTGPLTPAAIEAWLGTCEDGFEVYAATKSEKARELDAATKIRLTGMQLQEPITAAWWSSKRKDYLKLTTWNAFEEKIRARFLPKSQKITALRQFFLCQQGRLSLSDYVTALTEARNAIPDGSNVIPTSIFKYQLLFHSHPTLLLRVMAIHNFDIDSSTLGIDNLISLMSMQWDSLSAEGVIRHTCPPNLTRSPFPTLVVSSPLKPLSPTERERLTVAGGCWRCRKTPADSGWVSHVGRTCPGDPTKGISPGSEYVSPVVSPPTVEIKKEHVGALLLQEDHGEDQPEDSDYPRDLDTDSDDDLPWPGH